MKVLLISVLIVIGSLIRKSWSQQSQTNPSLFEFFYNYTFYKYDDTQQFDREYDFVIVGAGSGGCVLANRLSENSKWSVLLLEAGAGEENFLTDIPIFAPFLQQFSAFNWAYRTEPNKGFCLGSVDGRCNWPRGRGLGGTSLINFMIYSRGNRYDFDRWFQLGNNGWSYKDVLPYFKKSEMIQKYSHKLDFSFHGQNGSLNVEIPEYRTPLVKTFLKSARFFKYKSNDPNGKSQSGFSVVQATMKNGRRHSAAKAYLLPVRNRPNLFISKNSFVTRILIDPLTKTATGVKFHKNRKQRTVRVRKEVILSAGSINSPQLLMLSGVGPKSLLKRLRIPLMSDLNVGSNLQDHISVPGLVFLVNESVTFNDISIQSIRNYFDYFVHNRGPFTIPGGAEALAFINTKVTPTSETKSSSVPNDYPNIEIVSGCGSLNGDFLGSLRSLIGLRNDIFWETYGPILGRNAFSLVPVLLRPKSMGSIQLAANDPFSAPLIYPNFFHDPDDIRVLIDAIKWTINLTKSEPYRRFNTTLYTKPLMGCEQHKFGTDSYWECHIRTIAISLFHQSGTCKMGPRWDRNAVVDDRLRVYGVGNLRVADASIMPTIVSGHPNAAVFMIGEKAADFIKQTYRQ